MNPLLLTDFYKVHHNKMYPDGTALIYSNFTPRKSRMKGVDKVVFFGLQHFILTYLIEAFDTHFFKREKQVVVEEYKRHIPLEDIKHVEALHDLGYLPLEIKALPEGSLVPIKVPCFTVYNTKPDSPELFGWLVNYLETLTSCSLWQPITSATIAYEYKKLLSKYAKETVGSADFVQWQGHDFSMRGMSSVESAILSGMGHLTSFTGTDTIPAIYQLEKSYDGEGLIGASVPATEHSVMCMGTKEDEVETFKRLLNIYPTGILSVVSDTWDLWKVLTEILPKIKDQVLARDGKLVIRPDSGDPVDILCGIPTIEISKQEFDEFFSGRFSKLPTNVTNDTKHSVLTDGIRYNYIKEIQYIQSGLYLPVGTVENKRNESKGVIELLWDLFGGKVNDYGYKELDFHIGSIYGDSITLDRAREICERLKAEGFASTNVVLGIGSYTYQYNTRDTFGFAMKATYGEVVENKIAIDGHTIIGKETVGREIYKDPVTDDGTKKSAKGLLSVLPSGAAGTDYILKDQCTWEQEQVSCLQTVFKDGVLVRRTNLQEIRDRINSY